MNFTGAATSNYYVNPWIVRRRMIVQMRARGISQLAAVELMSVTDFAAHFPDQCKWVHRFGTGHATIQSVWAAQQCESPPELRTMCGQPSSRMVQRCSSALRQCEMHLKSGLAGYSCCQLYILRLRTGEQHRGSALNIQLVSPVCI